MFCTMNATKEYIIDHTYNLLLNHSYEAVSISEISKSIGFTKGALYHHFANKEELFKAVIDKHLTSPTKTIVDTNISLKNYINQAINRTRETLSDVINTSKEFAPLSYISLFVDALRHYPDFIRKKQVLVNQEIENIKMILNNAISNKEIRDDINVSITAINFLSLTYGVTGNFVQTNSLDSTISVLEQQLTELYNVLKK